METRRKPTLIIVRRTPTEAKAVLACATLESSFARAMASIALFYEERAPSRSFGRWDLFAMVEIRGDYKEVVRRAGREEESES